MVLDQALNFNKIRESLYKEEKEYKHERSECLNFIRNNQPNLRVDSFTGGPRYIFNNCKDAFAICKYVGYPSYFVAITCNPECDEIKCLLKDTGLKVVDRPDIVSRNFHIKLNELIMNFKQGKFFGKISAYVCIIEFQKRRLPHAHILLFMDLNHTPKSPDQINKLISAEILDKIWRPKLYAAVEKFMVHRSKIDNGRSISKKNVVLDNSYIVPNNPSLLLKYGCHINVEQYQTSTIKYLFKYVHKGNDRVIFAFYQSTSDGDCQQVVDEIHNYYDCRYIAVCEAAWRVFWYNIQQKEPSIIRLPFHLPNEHPAVFKDHENIIDVIERVDELQLSDEQILNLTLYKIEEKLQANGRSLKEYDQMPLPSLDAINGIEDCLIMDEMNFDLSDLRDELLRNLPKMNLDQRKAFNTVIQAVNKDVGGFFVYGYGSTVKTYLYKTPSTTIRSKGEIVLNVASSGIASLLFPNVRTTYSRFKIPLDLNEDSVYIRRYEKCYNPDLPFGGKVVLLGGDFRQILPVIPMGSRQDIVLSSINSSYLWEFCKVLKLTINMHLTVGANQSQLRQISEFATWLLSIGDSLIGDSTDGESEVTIPNDILI
ncbi:uncharacterized protein LOC107613435 [Arachis ipaensis]|uniref:uncharacterized protein LOC107613435 n=1 Tax=Arachis ipaensis TaxID=130454 RepID=UPI0007AF03B7|nr:uncharacterized protein LOC107613435 [Arachis ipaensis]XP_025628687.1 uncharacterized protein LOC112721880 [Arachis hypogaea]